MTLESNELSTCFGGYTHTSEGKDGQGRTYTDEYDDENCNGVFDVGEPGKICID